MNTTATASSLFSFDSHPVRITRDGDELWFVAQDVMSSLEYAEKYRPAKATEHVPAEWRGVYPIHTPGGTQKMLCISEPGLYFFLGRSDKPKALPFQKWLAGEVLPAIRKTGSYSVAGDLFTEIHPGVDVGALLLDGQSTPTLALPKEVEDAINERTWDLTREAHGLIHEHLRRRVAYCAEVGYPERRINTAVALKVIQRGRLGEALAHQYHEQMAGIEMSASSIARDSKAFLEKVQSLKPASASGRAGL